MPELDAIARRLLIHGLVQGVSYRASAAAEARRLGLDGWVRNRADSTVEALVTGPEEKVEAFTAWARRGPPSARVSRVDVFPGEPTGPGFSVRPDS
jgi:acylphosphatase